MVEGRPDAPNRHGTVGNVSDGQCFPTALTALFERRGDKTGSRVKDC